MAFASAARSDPSVAPPAAAMSSSARSCIQGVLPRLLERELAVEAGHLEQAVDRFTALDQRHLVAIAARADVPAGEQDESGRIHEREIAQVDDEAAAAGGERVLERSLDIGSGRHVELAGELDAGDAVDDAKVGTERRWMHERTPGGVNFGVRATPSPERARPPRRPARRRPPRGSRGLRADESSAAVRARDPPARAARRARARCGACGSRARTPPPRAARVAAARAGAGRSRRRSARRSRRSAAPAPGPLPYGRSRATWRGRAAAA